jgi:hypothetical protein
VNRIREGKLGDRKRERKERYSRIRDRREMEAG